MERAHSIIQIHQIDGRIGKIGGTSIGPCPARSRIDRRDVLGNGFGRCAEGGIVQRLDTLVYSPGCQIGGQTLLAFDPTSFIGIGGDQAGINAEALANKQAFIRAALQNRPEQMPEQSALTEAAVPVLRNGRVVGNRISQVELTELSVRQDDVNLFTQTPLRSNALAVPKQ